MDYGGNPVADLQAGFKNAFNQKIDWTWTTQDTVFTVVVLLLFAAIFLSSRMFARYRVFVRARRRERKKREFLRRLLLDSSGDPTIRTELFKRLVRYYFLDEVSSGMTASAAQLVTFTQSLFRLIRRLEYDKKGRLVIEELEQEILEAARPPHPAEPEVHRVHHARIGLRVSEENMSKAARVALNLIRFRKNIGA